MKGILVLAALGNVVSAINVVVTTICNSATYPTTLNPLIDIAYSSATSAGSTASRYFASADPRNMLYPGMFTSYSSAILSFQTAVGSVTSLSNADISEITTVEAQLAAVLHAMANTYGPLMNLRDFINLVDTLGSSASAENAAINGLIQAGVIACDQQDSLYSAAQVLGSSLSVVSAKSWFTSYMSTSLVYTGITTKACTADCTTLTMIGADTTTSSTGSSTSNGDITSSRTVSGTVERCLVRPTSTSSTSTAATITEN